MSWWRIDDGAADHPKFLALEELGAARYAAAIALWWRAGCYTAKHRLDGLVPAVFLRRSMPIPRKMRAASDLVSVGLWVRSGEDFAFHDWRDRNPTAKEQLAKTAKKSERQARWREKKRREAEGEDEEDVDASTPSTRSAAPIPTPPIPSDTSSDEETSDASAPDTSAPSDGEVIREHEERFGKGLVRATRDAVGLSRKTGKIADSVWARTLSKLAAHGDRPAVDAMKTFVEKYGDGDKGEGYLVAIARNLAKGTGRQTSLRGTKQPAAIGDFDDVEARGADQLAAQVAADRDRRRRGTG